MTIGLCFLSETVGGSNRGRAAEPILQCWLFHLRFDSLDIRVCMVHSPKALVERFDD